MATAANAEVRSGSVCTRSDVDGCRERGAQGLAGAVSVVVLSRSLTVGDVEMLAIDLALGLAALVG
jgi:hypothetical protein